MPWSSTWAPDAAAVGGHQRAADHGAADHQRGAGAQQPAATSSAARPAPAAEMEVFDMSWVVPVRPAVEDRPRRTGSAATRMCTSWMRAVRSCGTQMCTSVSRSSLAHLAAVAAGQRDHGHVPRVRGLDRGQHVGRVAAGADGQQHVARRAQRPHLLGEDGVEVVVVGDGGEDRACRSSARSRPARAVRARSGRRTRRRSAARRWPSRRCRRPAPCRRR